MLDNTGRASNTALKQHYFKEKVGFFKGILRYLGFLKVKTIHSHSYFSGQRNRHRYSDKPLKQRTVTATPENKWHSSGSPQPEDEYGEEPGHNNEPVYEMGIFDNVFRKCNAFRSTGKNVRKLADELMGCLGTGFESHEDKLLRVELSLTLCGIGRIKAGLLSGRGRHSISTARLTELDRYLHMPLNKLVKLADNSGGFNYQNLHARHPLPLAALTEKEILNPASTGHDVVTRIKMCQNYLLYGEGRQVLKSCGFSEADRIEQLFPPIPESIHSPYVLMSVQALLQAATNEQEVSYKSLNIPGITFAPGVVRKQYNPNAPQHKTLAVLQELQNLYEGLYSGYSLECTQKGNEPEEGLSDEKTMLQEILTGAAHAVMKKAFPQECNESSYQQVHLKNDFGQLRWNSDSVQPRGGWREEQVFEPVKTSFKDL